MGKSFGIKAARERLLRAMNARPHDLAELRAAKAALDVAKSAKFLAEVRPT